MKSTTRLIQSLSTSIPNGISTENDLVDKHITACSDIN